MSGFLLQLGGPLQSWGEHSAFTDRDTVAHPTRSGLIGMTAAALGISRADARADATDQAGAPSDYARLTHLRFTLRIDRPGTHLTDFHTVGGGHLPHRTLPVAKGGRRSGPAATLVSYRHYLADAVFTVAVTAADDAFLNKCAEALARPRWPLHLGRRSCPPAGLLLLRTDVPDPVGELDLVPLARPRPRDRTTAPLGPATGSEAEPAVTVRFIADEPFTPDEHSGLPGRGPVTMLNDDPVRVTARDRVYRARPSYTTTRQLPAHRCAGYGSAYLDALTDYLHSSRTEGSAP